MSEYKTVAQESCEEFVEKRSKFIGYAKPVKSEAEAVEFINQIKSRHWDATHNVYAYCLREGQLKRYSDDGEPQGTAGVPTLEVLVKNDVTDVVVVVTRYFGGILLGAGGLVRAYSHGAKLALNAAQPIIMKECVIAFLKCTYNQYGKLSSLVPSMGGVIYDTGFTDEVEIKFHIPKEDLARLSKQVAEVTGGSVIITESGTDFYPVRS